MGPEGSLPHEQDLATCPYPDPDQSSKRSPIYFFNIHFNVIFPSMPRSSKCFPFLRFSHQIPVCTSPLFIRATCSAHHSFLDSITLITFGDYYRSWSPSLCSLLHSPVASSLLGPNIFVSTLFSKTLSQCSSLSVRDQVSHPRITTGKVIVQC